MRALKDTIRSWLRPLGIEVTSAKALTRLSEAAYDLEVLRTLPAEHAPQLLKLLPKSRSQRRQDLFVLSELDFKRNGFFVEFGAADGVYLSNTYVLEKEFGWTGILAEPAKAYHRALSENRAAHIEYDCVWENTGSTLSFKEPERPHLSTIEAYSGSDHHRDLRKRGKTYDVRTISLLDLLKKHQAPKDIDYLSIDTEGSEFDILNSFDFGAYSFRVITCEHNRTQMREKLFTLLSSGGYRRKYENLSAFEDWYVRS